MEWNSRALSRRRFNKKSAAYALMLVPFLAFFFLFTVLPILASIVLSFFDYDMVSPVKFIGLDNYLRMAASDEIFPAALKNTIVFAVITGPIGFLLSFMLAWFLNEFRPQFRALLAFLFYAPALTGNAYFVWGVLFSGDSYGYMNSMLLTLGTITEPIQWLKNVHYNFTIVLIVQLWMSMGVSFLANLSGLQNTNPELYEAGAIDGIRTRWHELWYITLPGMKSILFFSAVMQIASAFSISDVITNLVGYPSVNHSVDTIVTLLSDVGNQRYEMGYAAAISVILFGMMALFRLLVVRVLNKTGK